MSETTVRSVTVACPFCTTLNKIDLSRHAEGPRCAECKKPFRLDRPVKVAEDHFDKTVLEAEVPVLVDFYADWCSPCIMMAPLLDEIAKDLAGRVLVAKVDTDAAPSVGQKYGIRSIPFFARFEGGEIAESAAGAQSREQLTRLAMGQAP